MPRKKVTTPLTYGYLPSGLAPQTLVDLCKGRVKADLILIFYKYLLNRSTVRYETKSATTGKKKRYVGTGAPDITAAIEIHSDYFEKLFGNTEAHKYKQFMVENNLIKIAQASVQGGIATRYTIPWELFHHDLFANTRIYRKVPIYDKRSYNAERILYAFRKKKSLAKLAPEYQELVKVLETLRIDLSGPQVQNLVDTYKLDHAMSNQSAYSYLDFLEAVDGRDIEYFIVDPFGTRFHTVWTTIMKGLRGLLYFTDCPDKKLVSCDIVNSQPWLTAVITPTAIRKYVPSAVPFIPYFEQMQKSADYGEYRALCLSGSIYEHWIKVLEREVGVFWRDEIAAEDQAALLNNPKKKAAKNAAIDSHELTDRQAAKICMYRVIFGTANSRNPNLLHKAFEAEWPSVAKCFNQVKSKRLPDSPSKKVYANLCLVMQRLESEAMKRFIAKFFANGINHMVTIFDGVLVLEDQQALAYELMFEVIEEMQLDAPQIAN